MYIYIYILSYMSTRTYSGINLICGGRILVCGVVVFVGVIITRIIDHI